MSCTPSLAATVSFAASGVTTYTCKRPELNNGEPIDPHIILMRTRNGDLYVYKRGGLLKKLSLKFRGFRKDQSDDFRTFISDSAGKVITYTNHFSVAYTGVISSFDFAEEQNEKGFTVDLTFEIA